MYDQICEALGKRYTELMKGKCWATYDEDKKCFIVRGENLPAHPELQATYPKGWSMLQEVTMMEALTSARELGITETPKFLQGCVKGTYTGQLSYFHGKTALLRPAVLAQFDDLGTYVSHGWHPFDAKDFSIQPIKPLYAFLAMSMQARLNCIKSGNKEWIEKHTEHIETLVKNYMPSGSGFDCGTTLDLDESNGDKLVFLTDFHHMDESGGYCGWSKHTVVVYPSLAFGFTLRVTGPNRNDIKDYIHQAFYHALSEEIQRAN